MEHLDSTNNSDTIETLEEKRFNLTASSCVINGNGCIMFTGGKNEDCSNVVDLYTIDGEGDITHYDSQNNS